MRPHRLFSEFLIALMDHLMKKARKVKAIKEKNL